MFAFFPIILIFVIAPIALIVFGIIWFLKKYTNLCDDEWSSNSSSKRFWSLDNDND